MNAEEVERRLVGAYEAAKAAVVQGAELPMAQIPTFETLYRSARQPIRWVSPVVLGTAVAMIGGTVATAVVVTNWKADLSPVPKPSLTYPTTAGTPQAAQKSQSGVPAPTLAAPPPSEPWLQKTPASLVVGQRFPYSVYTHCGFNQIELGGRRWAPAEPVPPVPEPRLGPGGIATVNGYTAGVMTLLDAQTLRFAVDDATVQTAGVVVTYRIAPADALPEVCA